MRLDLFLTILIVVISFEYESNAQWVRTNLPADAEIHALAVSGTSVFAGGPFSGAFKTSDNGANWSSINNGLTITAVEGLFVNGGDIFAGTQSGAFRSTNTGVDWFAVGLGGRVVGGFAVNGTTLFAGTYGNGVFVSSNSGANWNATGALDPHVGPLAVSGGVVFAGCVSNGGLFLSTNNGANWTLTSVRNVQALAANQPNVFAGNPDGVYISTDNGSSWTSTPSLIQVVFSLTLSGDNIFAGTYRNGVFLSTNNGTSWTAVGSGLPRASVGSLAISGSYLFAGTDSSVWRRPLAEMITAIEESSSGLPLRFGIAQNYPNPFNPSTTIQFSMPQREHVLLQVFNLLGEEVATLVDEELSAGSYSKNWEANGFASGVYLYRIRAGSFLATKKLLLVR